jgi:hypothetical protein
MEALRGSRHEPCQGRAGPWTPCSLRSPGGAASAGMASPADWDRQHLPGSGGWRPGTGCVPAGPAARGGLVPLVVRPGPRAAALSLRAALAAWRSRGRITVAASHVASPHLFQRRISATHGNGRSGRHLDWLAISGWLARGLLARGLLMTWHDALSRPWLRRRHPNAATPGPVRAGAAGARPIWHRPRLCRHGGVCGGWRHGSCPACAGRVAGCQAKSSRGHRSALQHFPRAGHPGWPSIHRCRGGSVSLGTAGAVRQRRRCRPGRLGEGGREGGYRIGTATRRLATPGHGTCGRLASAGRRGAGVPAPRRPFGRRSRAGCNRNLYRRGQQRPVVPEHRQGGCQSHA